jgi:hypothetical protein
VRPALALLSGVPWYAWGAGAAALALGVLTASSAGAASEGPERPAGTPPLLQLGSSGPWVAYLRARLGLAAGDSFDAELDAALRAFQSAKGLASDGKAGPATWGALGVSGAQPAPPGAPAPAPSPGPPPAPANGNPLGLADSIATREQQILALVQAGKDDHEWVPLSWTKDGRAVSVLVSRRALAVVGDDGTRLTVNATMPTAQKIADMLGGAMMTTRVADEIQKQADVAFPFPEHDWNYKDLTGTKTSRMYDQSAILDWKVAGRPGLVSGEGKDWIVSRRTWLEPAKAHNAVNFGGYGTGSGKSPGGLRVAQSIGLAHNMGHTDYSQLLRFVKLGSLTIDGEAYDWGQALADPALSGLLQDEGGTIPSPRHPDL